MKALMMMEINSFEVEKRDGNQLLLESCNQVILMVISQYMVPTLGRCMIRGRDISSKMMIRISRLMDLDHTDSPTSRRLRMTRTVRIRVFFGPSGAG